MIIIREPNLDDEKRFLAAMQRSYKLHDPWVKPPQTSDEFKKYIEQYQKDNQKSYLVCDSDGNIVGVFNISEIVRGHFQSAYLGFFMV